MRQLASFESIYAATPSRTSAVPSAARDTIPSADGVSPNSGHSPTSLSQSRTAAVSPRRCAASGRACRSAGSRIHSGSVWFRGGSSSPWNAAVRCSRSRAGPSGPTYWWCTSPRTPGRATPGTHRQNGPALVPANRGCARCQFLPCPLLLAARPTSVQTCFCISGLLNFRLCRNPSMEAISTPSSTNGCGAKFESAEAG